LDIRSTAFLLGHCSKPVTRGLKEPGFFQKKPKPVGFIGLVFVGFFYANGECSVKQIWLIKLAAFLVVRWQPVL